MTQITDDMLTPEFPADVKPVRPGVYQVRPHLHAAGWSFSRWNGRYWSLFRSTAAKAARSTFPSGTQNKRWRGLKEKAE